ncbi:mediator of RNA polymerase II transcription complex subunit 8 domain-containing protein [Hirsutella rhossiliensis]|uniref:Mediator of RNA polymerase II transcription subunit 8 n=1 Tax=Hirsutella rhossiliensis TaxID=111463 RepID=A0A9P8MKA0_9HYPO|nr:mediator of RNA polymerase II transcription complex subunit 8 domain-containing protein [Hirsutella rhossiliensis]KAH0957883.1 mediator of RNA polymerase II transcription complex subunit 8 domain-containing protein [Hirsutella rhossiliensis]
MATLSLDEDELKSVEQTLARLAQLSSSIQSLKMDILKSNPLPHPSSLQASAQILQRNLQTVLDNLSENSDLFARMAIHPSTNYPGRTQENLLTQLLRKKLEPDVEELVADGRETARLATPEGVVELQAIWDELRQWTHERIAAYVRDEAGDVYTKDERATGTDKVRTGLRRGLDEESDDDDDDDDDDEEADEAEDGIDDDGDGGDEGKKGKTRLVRGPEPETLLWFAARGDFEVPRNVEYERKVGLRKGLEGVNIPPARPEGAEPA